MSAYLHHGHGDFWDLGHKVTFAPLEKLVIPAKDAGEIDFVVDVYSASKEWLRLRDNAKFLPPARTTGGDPIPGTSDLTGTTVFLTNGWRLLVNSGVLFDRNAFSDDFDSPFVTATGVELARHRFSNLVDTVGLGDVADAIATVPSAAENAAAVWQQTANLNASPVGSMGRIHVLSRYRGVNGPAVFYDSTAANTGTLVGVDGTPENPVSTLAAAEQIGLAIGVKRIQQPIGSTLTLDRDLEDWEIRFGTVDVDGFNVNLCKFYGPMILTGTVGSGTFGAYYYDVQFSSAAAISGEFYRCAFAGNVALGGGGVGYQFISCRSLDDTSQPTFDLTADPFNFGYEIDFRGWVGQLTIANSLRPDNVVAVDGNGGVTVAASCTAGLLRARGNVVVTNSSTGTFVLQDLRSSVLADQQLSTTHGAGSWEGGGGSGGVGNVLGTFTVAAGATGFLVPTDATQADGFFDGQVALIETAGGALISRQIRSYAGGVFELSPELPLVPSAGDTLRAILWAPPDPVVVGHGVG